MEINSLRKLILTTILVITIMYVTGGFSVFGLKIYNLIPLGGSEDIIFDYTKVLFVVFLWLVFLSLLAGRAFCGWLCPYGALVSLIGNSKGINFRSRYLKYAVLIVFIASGYFLSSPAFNYLCPEGSCFNLYVDEPGNHERLFEILKFLIPITLVGGTYYLGRMWCVNLCPVGVGLSVVSLLRLFRLKVGKECKRCKKCNSVCEMGLDVVDERPMEECTMCWKCVEHCPYKAIKPKFLLQE